MRHMKKREIIESLRQVKRIKETKNTAPFTAMATLCNYILWKKEQFSQEKLVRYNIKVAEHEELVSNNKVTLKELSDEIEKKAGFTVSYSLYKINKKSKSFRDKLMNDINESQNHHFIMSTRYMLIHFMVLIKMGCEKAMLNKNKDEINEALEKYGIGNGEKIEELKKELLENTGICIEDPKADPSV